MYFCFSVLVSSWLIAGVRPSFENMTVFTLSIHIMTGDVEEAGTDDNVNVQMNNLDKVYYLNSSRDDFTRNSGNSYYIISPNINKISDIQYLRLKVKGNDGLCIKYFHIMVNGTIIYKKSFTKCQWLDNDDPKAVKEIYIKASELRASPLWKYTAQNVPAWQAPTYIPYQVLTDMVESSIGNQIVYANESNGWASSSKTYGKAVEIKYINSNTIHFNLDFELYCTGINRAIDVSFDLKFEMKNSNLNVTVENIKSDHPNCIGPAQYNPFRASSQVEQAICSDFQGPNGICYFLNNYSNYYNKLTITPICNVSFSN